MSATTTITCHYCKKDPGTKNGVVWNGFFDKDTGHHVCYGCHNRHYHEKWKTEHKWKYSEFPVTIKPTA